MKKKPLKPLKVWAIVMPNGVVSCVNLGGKPHLSDESKACGWTVRRCVVSEIDTALASIASLKGQIMTHQTDAAASDVKMFEGTDGRYIGLGADGFYVYSESGLNLGMVKATSQLHALTERVKELERERDLLRGAMAAQDERERLAGEACGVSYHEHGCDWPDAVAYVVLNLRANIDELESDVAEIGAKLASVVWCLPPETLCGELQELRDEFKRLKKLTPPHNEHKETQP